MPWRETRHPPAQRRDSSKHREHGHARPDVRNQRGRGTQDQERKDLEGCARKLLPSESWLPLPASRAHRAAFFRDAPNAIRRSSRPPWTSCRRSATSGACTRPDGSSPPSWRIASCSGGRPRRPSAAAARTEGVLATRQARGDHPTLTYLGRQQFVTPRALDAWIEAHADYEPQSKRRRRSKAQTQAA